MEYSLPSNGVPSEPNIVFGDDVWRYTQPDDAHLVIDGHDLHVELHRDEEPLLVSRGFDPRQESVVSQTTQEQKLDVKTLTPGEYRWGVYIDGKVPRPLFLKPRKLVVKNVPRAVVTLAS